MSILEQLYDGALRAEATPPSPQEQQAHRETMACYEEFEPLLTPAAREKYDELEGKQNYADSFRNVRAFSDGFALGALLMAELFARRGGSR